MEPADTMHTRQPWIANAERQGHSQYDSQTSKRGNAQGQKR